MTTPLSIQAVIDEYIDLRMAQNVNTANSYKSGLKKFADSLRANGIDPDSAPITSIDEQAMYLLLSYTKDLAPASERLYIDAVTGLFQYINAQEYKLINLTKLKYIVKVRARKAPKKLPNFPKSAIESLLNQVNSLVNQEYPDENSRLIALRDRALILTLADTGLRIHEALRLTRGDMDYTMQQAIIIGKGNKQALIRFSERSIKAIQAYLAERTLIMDGTTGKQLASLPLFSRHDRGAGNKVKPITTTTGRNIVKDRVSQLLEPEAKGTIHPHSLRHRFVTEILRKTGNLKLAQELARHENITITKRYAHLTDSELDAGYSDVFEKS